MWDAAVRPLQSVSVPCSQLPATACFSKSTRWQWLITHLVWQPIYNTIAHTWHHTNTTVVNVCIQAKQYIASFLYFLYICMNECLVLHHQTHCSLLLLVSVCGYSWFKWLSHNKIRFDNNQGHTGDSNWALNIK